MAAKVISCSTMRPSFPVDTTTTYFASQIRAVVVTSNSFISSRFGTCTGKPNSLAMAIDKDTGMM